MYPKTIRLPEVCSTLIPVFLDGLLQNIIQRALLLEICVHELEIHRAGPHTLPMHPCHVMHKKKLEPQNLNAPTEEALP